MGPIEYLKSLLERFAHFTQLEWVIGLTAAVSLMIFLARVSGWARRKKLVPRDRDAESRTSNSARLAFSRGKHWFRGPYGVVVDDEWNGSIAAGEAIAVDVAPGKHSVRIIHAWTEEIADGGQLAKEKRSGLDRRDFVAGRTYDYDIRDRLFNNVELQFRRSYRTE